MKRLISIIMISCMLFSLSSCGFMSGFIFDEDETTTLPEPITSMQTEAETAAESTTSAELTVAEAASAAYEAYLAIIDDDDFPITHALVTDLDNNNIPEVIVASGETGHIAYLLSYGKTNGLSVYTPITHSSTGADIFISEEKPYIYYADNGHNQGTAWIHEGVSFRVGNEGFEDIHTYSGDGWDDSTEEIWNNNELFEEFDKRYDDIFEQTIEKTIGKMEFENFFEICKKSNIESYLNKELSIDIERKRDEYKSFRRTAKKIILDKAGIEPESLFVSDFDRNGTFEAFAYTGIDSKDEHNYPVKAGSLWFVNSDENIRCIREGTFSDDFSIIDGAFNDYFCAEDKYGKNIVPHIWKVNKNLCEPAVVLDDSNLCGIRLRSVNAYSNSIVFESNDYNTIVDDLNKPAEGGGKNRKCYFFFDSPDGIREYGANEITKDQLAKLGGQKYLDAVTKSGYKIQNILYRQNGIIHINIYKKAKDNGYSASHITLKETCSSVAPLDDNLDVLDGRTAIEEFIYDGFYLSASVDSIAIYP